MRHATATRLSPLSILLCSLLLTACGGGGGSGDDEGAPNINSGSGTGSSAKPGDGSGGDGGTLGDGDVVVEAPPVQEDIVLTGNNIEVLIAGRSLLDPIEGTITTTSLPAPVPLGFTRIGEAVALDISDQDQELLNGPVEVTMIYNDQALNFESNIVALGYNGTNYEPLTILERDTDANTITFDSRRIYSYVLAEMDGIVPAVADTGFLPSLNGWATANTGTYFAPGGNSFGMAGFAAWMYSETDDLLNNLYLGDTALRAAARAQMSQAETWGHQPWRNRQALSDAELALILQTFIDRFNTPLVLHLGMTTASRAVTVYGYDSGGFYLYDPNAPGEKRFLPFDGSEFGTYQGLTAVGYSTLASFGRNSDFAALAAEAEAGFPGSANIAIDTPVMNQQIDARETTLAGSFLNDLSEQEDLYVEVKGVGRQLAVSNGNYSNVIEISSGINTIVALAGVDSAVENNWFKDAPTAILEVEGTLPPARLLVTLTWEQDETDVDLYITEPEGETMWFGGSTTGNGLELDIDDTTGFGPEHGTLEVGGNDQVQDGNYRIRVHYYSDDGLDVSATGRVSIVINEGEEDQNTLNLRFRIDEDDASASGPDGSGSSWANIAVVNITENTITPAAEAGAVFGQ